MILMEIGKLGFYARLKYDVSIRRYRMCNDAFCLATAEIAGSRWKGLTGY